MDRSIDGKLCSCSLVFLHRIWSPSGLL